MNLELAICFWVLDLLPSEEIPEIAADALADGMDSRTLRIMAGERNPSWFEIAPLFQKVLEELKVQMPSRQVAMMQVAKHYAERVVSGQLHPYEGARAIWWQLGIETDTPDDLLIFVGLASEYEDFMGQAANGDPYYRGLLEKITNDIVSEARALLGK